jgi:membrane-associated phospholipid phosphatase
MRTPWLCGSTLACALLAAPVVAQEPTASSAAAEQQPGPIRRFAVTFARDVKELKSKESLVIFMNGGILALLAVPVDGSITLGTSSTRFLKAGFGTTGKLLGEEFVQAGTAGAAYLAGRLLGKPKLATVGADLLEAQFVSAAITQVLKFSVQRTRPDGEARSFPSGHASASFASATVLHRHFGAKAAVPAYGAAVYITMSRLQANSHYASDILIGAALGMAVGRAATITVPRTSVRLTPVAIPGGAGFSVDLP